MQQPAFVLRSLRVLLPGAAKPGEVLDRRVLGHAVTVVDDANGLYTAERVAVEDDVDLVRVSVERVPDQLGERTCGISGEPFEVPGVDGDGDCLHGLPV